MADDDRDEVPMLSISGANSLMSDEVVDDARYRDVLLRSRSATFTIPMDRYENENHLGGFTGPLRSERRMPPSQLSGPLFISSPSEHVSHQKPGLPRNKTVKQDYHWSGDKHGAKNEHLLRSGPLGMCSDPYCTTCPTYYNTTAAKQKHSRASLIFDHQFHNALYGDAKSWARRFFSYFTPYIPPVMNPHTKIVQRWNKFFVISCLVAIFLDPLFFFLLGVDQDNKCIYINYTLTTTIVVLRSVTDFVYLLNILLQFRLAYVAPESTVVGAGELVDHPKKIAKNYIRKCFFIDLFIVLPLPQIVCHIYLTIARPYSSTYMNRLPLLFSVFTPLLNIMQIIVLMVLPDILGSSGANYAKNLLRAAVLVQYIPRLYRFLPLLIGQSESGFIFETAWANFFINLLTFMLSGHVMGSCWYLFGLQRVNQCFRDACRNSNITNCVNFVDCGHGDDLREFSRKPEWKIWTNNVNATACFMTSGGFSYGIYAQAVNLTTKSSFITRYTYSLFWGFQNFLQALGRRRLEMSLRRRDVDQWMSHRRLPQELRRKVVEAERYNWAATRGANEELLLENLPEDLQREIRRHLFNFVKQVWIFGLMDVNVLDAICEKLKQRIYIKGSEIFYRGGVVDKMVFIVRGKLESVGVDGTEIILSEGQVCGEELLTWCLEHASSVSKEGKKIKVPGQRLISSRTVRCLTNVEAFSLRAIDLEDVTSIFARSLRNPRVQSAIRYASPYWRSIAAMRIQVAWRYRQKRLRRMESSSAETRPNWASSYPRPQRHHFA
ncbi:unnamed protein product [Linum tenue]|uniref:Cyclic nucleotide-binding domain-containing protein n=1 Tax=Linum tenue TaxID=586396 RepID=A0AAV0PPX1_9ROSI|nr:unnamed protein product [Linum tenue]